MSLQTALIRLSKHIEEVPVRYEQIPPAELVEKPAPNKWSKKEILGHLIDSALNNLKRFVDAQYAPQPYTVPRYQQDDAVIINGYQQLPPDHLLQLWVVLNRQVVSVASNIPGEKLAYTIITPAGEPHTLEWLVIDYVDHMEHHIKQVFG